MSTFEIGGRKIGTDQPVYIIAEMSANHGHDFQKAIDIIKAAKDAGADAVKLQTYTPDTMTIDCAEPPFIIGKGTIWEGRNLYELYGEAYTPWEWQPQLKQLAEELGMHLFSTPFDNTAVDFLEEMNVPCHKVASFEIVDIPLLKRIAATRKPVIMSTGMASFDEIDEAVDALMAGGCSGLTLLKCTSSYPARVEDMNLRGIPYLASRYGVPAGLSDHTIGPVVPIAAVAIGACVVEKHFTISRADGGPDSAFSLEPDEFRAMVDAVRATEKALGMGQWSLTEKEQASRVFRRSLFAVRDIAVGETLTRENMRIIRPGDGLKPKHFDEIVGRKAVREIRRGTPLSWDLIADSRT